MVCCLIDKNWAKRVAALRTDPFLHKVILSLLAADVYLAVMSFVKLVQTMDAEANLSIYFPDKVCDLPMRVLVMMNEARTRGAAPSVLEAVRGGIHNSSSDNDVEAMAVALAFVKKHFFLRRVLCGGSVVASIVNFLSVGAFHALHFWNHFSPIGSRSSFCSALEVPALAEAGCDRVAAGRGTVHSLYSGPSQLGEDLTKPLSDWTKGTLVVHAMASSFIAFVASLVGLGLMWRWCVKFQTCST